MSERTAHAAELDALLEPSLSQTRVHVPPYSVRAGFFVAFFGGVYATLAWSALNSRRLGRLRADAWLYVVLALIWTAVTMWLGYADASRSLPSWLSQTGEAGRGLRYLLRALSLAVFGLGYWRLRRFYTAAAFSDEAAPNPWKVGLGCVLMAAALTYGVGLLGATFAPPPRMQPLAAPHAP